MPHENDEDMLNEDGETGEEISHETQTQLNGRLKALEQQQQMLAVLGDPDVRKVLEAKRTGRKIEVVEPQAAEPEPEPNPLADLPEDDPVRGTLEKITQLVDAKLQKALGPLAERLEQVSGVADEVKRRDVTDQVTAAKSKYKDLPQYRDAMVKLSEAHPGLSVEDLYLLSKNRAGKLRLVENVTETEKPSAQPRRRAEAGNPKAPVRPRGRKGFTDILAEAIGNLDVSKFD